MFKKMTCLLLSLMLLFTMFTPAAATSEAMSAYDLEAYMQLTSQGLIAFDVQDAIADGFAADMVARVQTRVDFMNSLVLDGVTTISEDFTAKVYLDRTRSSGTYVEYNTWGYTVYYSVSDTQKIVNNLPSGAIWVFLQDILDEIASTQGLLGFGLSLTVANVRNAAANGTGIYIQVYDDGTTALPLCFIGPR